MSEVKREPPPAAVFAAIAGAQRSPCRKSKRGAVLFHPFAGLQTSPAFNSRPDLKCDERCFGRVTDQLIGKNAIGSPPSVCSMMCLHAEQRALRFAIEMSIRMEYVADGDFRLAMQDLELVHVKVDDRGELVPSGPPSCWQCAKEIADTGIFGVWLYEDPGPAWNFYPTKTFYERTLQEVGIVRTV